MPFFIVFDVQTAMKIRSAEFVQSAASPKQFPSDKRPQIAFAGRSNVGKSSLINSLLHRKNLVKTSATPGKTQMINFFIINDQFYFVDLPGYGYARAPRSVVDAWAPMIEGYLTSARQLRAVVVLLDIRRTPDERDRRLMEWLQRGDVSLIFVVTKADKVKRQEMRRARDIIRAELGIDGPLILTSAKSGAGIDELWKEIHRNVSM